MSAVGFSVRAMNIFDRKGIETLGDLASHSPDQLMALRDFGKTTLAETRRILARYGMGLRDDPESPAWRATVARF